MEIIIGAFALLIMSAGFIWWLVYYIHIKLPEQQRKSLSQFARMAVLKVEYQYSALSSTQKKAIAIQIIEDSFQEAGIPTLGATIIDATIEAHVYMLRKEQTESRLEELKMDIEQAMIPDRLTSLEIPVVKLPETPRVQLQEFLL